MIDDLSRNVYCVLGIPIDVIELPSVLRDIEMAAVSKTPLFISTPNVNFLVNSDSDPQFRESLIQSDLCPADGLPIVWMARLVGVPIRSRIAGSDIFEKLKSPRAAAKPLNVFLFGGAEGVAAAASRALNAQPSGLRCAGFFYPGLGSVAEMSNDEIIQRINLSGADLLVVALGAKKGQAWLLHNHSRIIIPVCTHLGAVINFQAGMVRRAPIVMQKFGLEWLWRIKEEPYLWKRYYTDGKALLHLCATRIIPISIIKLKSIWREQHLIITPIEERDTFTLSLSGSATARHAANLIHVLRTALGTNKQIVIDFSKTTDIDARAFGLLLMLRKTLKERGDSPLFVGPSAQLRKIFRLYGVAYLLSDDKSN